MEVGLSSGASESLSNPLGLHSRPCLGGHPRHVGQAVFPPVLIQGIVVGSGSLGRGLGVTIGHLVALDPDVLGLSGW